MGQAGSVVNHRALTIHTCQNVNRVGVASREAPLFPPRAVLASQCLATIPELRFREIRVLTTGCPFSSFAGLGMLIVGPVGVRVAS